MRIAYVLTPDVIISNRSNGIRSQAETWANLLRLQGIDVDFVNNWGDYCWSDYDIIHIFGEGKWMYNVVRRLSFINSNIVYSPIIDPFPSKTLFLKNRIKRFLQTITCNKFQWFYSDQIKTLPYIQRILVRSEFERDFVSKAWGVSKEKIDLVPLSYSSSCKEMDYNMQEKEKFCLHISSIYQERKNVIRLIEASKKYNFKLVLAGNKGTEEQYQPIKDAIAESPNIQVLGYISKEEKTKLYQKAKVFALPSLYEGVGIVALDAALYGCEIVITDIPGPKEYYKGKCLEVSPYDVDSIGHAVKDLLSGTVRFQPSLSMEVAKTYSAQIVIQLLLTTYKKVFK